MQLKPSRRKREKKRKKKGGGGLVSTLNYPFVLSTRIKVPNSSLLWLIEVFTPLRCLRGQLGVTLPHTGETETKKSEHEEERKEVGKWNETRLRFSFYFGLKWMRHCFTDKM